MKKLFLSFAILAVFLTSLSVVFSQESQKVGVGSVVAIQCYHNSVQVPCSQTSTTTTSPSGNQSSSQEVSTNSAVVVSTNSGSSSTASTSSTSVPTSSITETPTETSSLIPSNQTGQTSSFDLSNPIILVIIFIAIVAAIIVLYKKGFSRGSGFKYNYKP